MRFEHEIRKELNNAIEARRGIMRVFQPLYQLVISALKWSLGEGKKDKAAPGFGTPRGEYEIRERLEACRKRRDTARMLGPNWQVIVASLEWVVGDSDITPLEVLTRGDRI